MIESQTGLELFSLRRVACITMLDKNRPDFALKKIHLLRCRITCNRFENKAEVNGGQCRQSGHEQKSAHSKRPTGTIS
jgi:hypothetical protein